MNPELRCASCGRMHPSVYYFAAPGLCIDCAKRPASDVSQPVSLRRLDVDQSAAETSTFETPRFAWYIVAAALGTVWGLSSHSESREAFAYDVTLNALVFFLLLALAIWRGFNGSPLRVFLRFVGCALLIVAFFRLFALR